MTASVLDSNSENGRLAPRKGVCRPFPNSKAVNYSRHIPDHAV
jgi:hypothetical protein